MAVSDGGEQGEQRPRKKSMVEIARVLLVNEYEFML